MKPTGLINSVISRNAWKLVLGWIGSLTGGQRPQNADRISSTALYPFL